jgi:hypothetical protein
MEILVSHVMVPAAAAGLITYSLLAVNSFSLVETMFLRQLFVSVMTQFWRSIALAQQTKTDYTRAYRHT